MPSKDQNYKPSHISWFHGFIFWSSQRDIFPSKNKITQYYLYRDRCLSHCKKTLQGKQISIGTLPLLNPLDNSLSTPVSDLKIPRVFYLFLFVIHVAICRFSGSLRMWLGLQMFCGYIVSQCLAHWNGILTPSFLLFCTSSRLF